MKLSNQFEDRIHRETWARGHYCARIPTGARVLGKGKVAMIKTPFDFAAGVHGKAVFFDAKSTAEGTFNIGSKVMATKSSHQFHQLMEAHRAGSVAGYLIWFYAPFLRYITWVPITVMARPQLVSIRPGMSGTTSIDDNRQIDLAVLCGIPSAPRGTPLAGLPGA